MNFYNNVYNKITNKNRYNLIMRQMNVNQSQYETKKSQYATDLIFWGQHLLRNIYRAKIYSRGTKIALKILKVLGRVFIMIQKKITRFNQSDILKKINNEPNIVISVPSLKPDYINTENKPDMFIYQFKHEKSLTEKSISVNKFLYKISGHLEN